MIETPDTAAAIRDALQLPRTADSANAVKAAVARSIRAVDAAVAIETTEYFNNSYAPDLVLNWDRAPRGSERYVFLRFNEEPEWISEELPRLEKRHPLIYGLFPTVQDERAESLAERSKEADTLVTDPGGVDRLASVPPSGIASFVSRTLIRGGRGLVDRPRAESATTDLAVGFQAARTGDSDRTKIAAVAATEFLRAPDSQRVLRFLQAMWVASGASPEAFPGAVGTGSDPGDEALRFLIEHDEITDADFWRAFGPSLSIERLANLGIHGSPLNLQHIVRANLDKLWARAFRVRADQPRLDETEQALLWRIELNLLALTGSNFTAYLGSSVEDIAQIKVEDAHGGVSVGDLRQRSRTIAVESLELTNGERVVTYGSSDQQTDVAGDDELSTLATALGSARVQRATVAVNGRHLELDFTTTTAAARTSGRPPVIDILGVGLPLLWRLSDIELHAFSSMMTEARDQQTLELFGPDVA